MTNDNKYDVYHWILRVINSSETIYHTIAAAKLITLYRKRYTTKTDRRLYKNLQYVKGAIEMKIINQNLKDRKNEHKIKCGVS